MSRRWWAVFHATLLLAALCLGLVLGGERPLSPREVIGALLAGGDETASPALLRERSIVLHLRIPRLLAGSMVGASLALAGVLMQGLFRNPLASPGILGATAGGTFGAVLAIALLRPLSRSVLSVPACAVAGTIFALVIVYLLAAGRSRLSISHLILCGMAVNTILAAGTSLILTLSQDQYWIGREIVNWLTGTLTNSDWEHVQLILPIFAVAAPFSMLAARDLDLVLAGEESAQTLGVRLERLKARVLVLSALLTGGAVAIAGMIGFVGLVVPHIVRLLQGPSHRGLMLSAPLLGGAFLVGCDILAQRLISPGEIQIGIITSLIGGPFFLFLLIRDRSGA